MKKYILEYVHIFFSVSVQIVFIFDWSQGDFHFISCCFISLIELHFQRLKHNFLRKLSKLENRSSLSVSKHRLNSCGPQRRPKFMMTHSFRCKCLFSVVAVSSKIVQFI